MATTALDNSGQAAALPGKTRQNVHAQMRLYRLALVLLDSALAAAAFQFSYLLRFSAGIPFFQDSIIPQRPFLIQVMWMAIPVWITVFFVMGLYRPQILLGGTREYSRVFHATTLGTMVIISVEFLFPDSLVFARGWVILAWLSGFLLIATGRFLARRMVYALRQRGYFQNPAVIVGGNAEAASLAEQFRQNSTSGVLVAGYIDSHPNPALDSFTPWLGTLDDMSAIVARNGIIDLIVSSSAFTQQELLAIFRQYGMMKNVNLRLSSGLYEIITTGMKVHEIGMVPLVTVNKVRMTGSNRLLKLLLDYGIGISAAIITLPLFAIIAVMIKLDSPGPVIYRRRVMGVNGRQFDAFKFRTMHINADAWMENTPALKQEYEVRYKIRNDPRVTRVGRLLRRTSLDELPQLWNVVRNEMSIVGPRMISPPELDKYDRWDINLLTVKPGITGLWQVRGRSDVQYDERVRMDMYYIRNWTIWMDLQLLLQTIPAVLSRRGAY